MIEPRFAWVPPHSRTLGADAIAWWKANGGSLFEWQELVVEGLLALDDDMRDMIVRQASTQVLRVEAKKRGLRTLRESGLLAIFEGITTIEEVVRETIAGED